VSRFRPDDEVIPVSTASTFPASAALRGGLSEVVVALGAAVEEVVAADLDACTDDEIRGSVAAMQRTIDRLTAMRTRCLGTLETRALNRAGPGRERRALRAVHDEMAADLKVPRSEVEKDGRTGRRLSELPSARSAMADGDLSGGHAAVLADTLHLVDDADARAQVEARLLAAAADQDLRTFGRTARAVLVELDPDAAQRRLDRQHARRSLRLALTADGTLQVHGNGAGLDAEFAQTAIHAFRSPDAPGQRRSADARTWDAFVAMCRAALDAGAAPTDRGVKPHVLVMVHEPVLADRDGSGNGPSETLWSGPLPWSETRRILADCGVSRVLLDARSLPVEASAGVRSVPAAVRKGVWIRDRVCIADGCDVPAAWCQVMHLDVPYRLEGRLTMATAGLGCTYHHRRFDAGALVMTLVDGRPVVHARDRPPRAGPPGRGSSSG
jgi:hypothetical protein